MLRLRNRILPLLHPASSLPSPIHPGACHLLSTSTSTSTILPAPFSLEDYLVAAAASPRPKHARCPDPDPCKDCGITQWLDSKFPETATRHMNYLVDFGLRGDARAAGRQPPGGAPRRWMVELQLMQSCSLASVSDFCNTTTSDP